MQAKRGNDTQTVGVDELVTSVLTASRLLVSVSARSLAAIEDTLTLPQFRMLVLLDSRGAMNISRLGEHLDVNPSTAMRMVDRLVAAGMVTRDSDASPGRAVAIALTTAGHRVVQQVTTRRRKEIARIVLAMPAQQRARLIEALDTFSAAGGEPRAAEAEDADLGW
jgi:DNA-binding MarR family transcriptional regulator